MRKGVVIKSTGSWYAVEAESGDIFNCRIKGKFRIKGIKATNPVAVGDIVEFEEREGDDSVITKIFERKNYIIRRSTNLSKQFHIIAANVDQAMLIVTINYPVTSTVFIDRFLLSAEAYSIPVFIVFNKTDLYKEADKDKLNKLISVYEEIGYECIKVSAKEDLNTNLVEEILKHKVTVLAGHSGVGKSTLINKIEPGLDLKTSEISDSHQTGKHTTTFAEMYRLGNGGCIIDTPGIRGYGLFDMAKEELSHFFPEIFRESEHCKFYNCTHVHEPGCAVVAAVKEGRISLSRYESYLSLMLEDEDEKYR